MKLCGEVVSGAEFHVVVLIKRNFWQCTTREKSYGISSACRVNTKLLVRESPHMRGSTDFRGFLGAYSEDWNVKLKTSHRIHNSILRK